MFILRNFSKIRKLLYDGNVLNLKLATNFDVLHLLLPVRTDSSIFMKFEEVKLQVKNGSR